MGVPHVVVLAAALVALLCLPCAVAVLICADDLAVRRAWGRRSRSDRIALRRLDRELCGVGPVQNRPPVPAVADPAASPAVADRAALLAAADPGASPAVADPAALLAAADPAVSPAAAVRDPAPAVVVPFEQVAADLRRLGRQRHTGPATTSERWASAVLLAYDERLKLACRYLAVDHHLDAVDGLDRDLERVRVEAELQAAGLDVRTRREA